MAKYKEIKETLKDIWYPILPVSRLAKGRTKAIQLADTKIVLGRSATGEVFALRDLCPHRAVPLSQGHFDGNQIECCYHGWCFDTQGQCTSIPALGPEPELDTTGIRVQQYPVRVHHGLIWIYLSAGDHKEKDIEEDALPWFPLDANQNLKHVSTHHLQCDMDNAVIGLIDPAHVPSVHGSWLWRNRHNLKKKTKKYTAFRRGFVMEKHLRHNKGLAALFLGKEGSTEIYFQLPGVRIEHIRYGNKNLVLILALQPVHEELTILTQYYFTDIPIVKTLFPFLKMYGTRFLDQDVDVVSKQIVGLRQNPKTMLLGDADRLAVWYYNLKEAQLQSTGMKTPFQNPIKPATLEWYT